ncbi:MAG TPA: NTF2 fold immunity protein [Candidatus Limnocylindria bacterium]|nr:NTF2 fold immunity protein [Candidatus Limnocylindria bacterium]
MRPLLLLGGVLLIGLKAADAIGHYVPAKGFVPDEQPAIRIAEAVWIPIYGEEMIKEERPAKATLADDVWTVRGSWNKGPNMSGGVAEAKISKPDGRIIMVTHGK